MALADPTDYGNEPGTGGPLRQGGVAVDGMPQSQANLPSTRSAASARQEPAVTMVRDLWCGTEKLRERSTAYLPKAPGEDTRNYNARLSRSAFFNAFRRTVEGMTGLVFRTDPQLSDDVPPQIREHWENIDNAGTHGDVFAREMLQDALAVGHTLCLVEYPNTGGRVLTLADEAPLRPYWVPIKKENVMSWRTAVIGGRTVLTQIVLEERQQVADGAFGEREQVRYRVLYKRGPVVGWQLLEVNARREVVLVGEGTYPTQDEIPIFEVTTSGRVGILESEPPLLDLAYRNVVHYQVESDYLYSIHKTCVPILTLAGYQPPAVEDGAPAPQLVVGPNSAFTSPDPAFRAAYVSHDGAALGSVKAALDDLKSDIGTLGLAMLAPQKRTAETAEAKRLDKATSDSALSVTARALQDGIERGLGFHARYMGLEDGGSCEVNRDFEGMAMDPAVMGAFAALIAQGLPWDLALDQLQKGRRIAEEVDTETVALEIATSKAADQAFAREQREAQFGQPPQDDAEDDAA